MYVQTGKVKIHNYTQMFYEINSQAGLQRENPYPGEVHRSAGRNAGRRDEV